jgi:acyl-coenzyme A thioesterase PaaI-like protein
VLHAGRSTAVAEGRLVDGKGKLLAIGTTACAVIRP